MNYVQNWHRHVLLHTKTACTSYWFCILDLKWILSHKFAMHVHMQFSVNLSYGLRIQRSSSAVGVELSWSWIWEQCVHSKHVCPWARSPRLAKGTEPSRLREYRPWHAVTVTTLAPVRAVPVQSWQYLLQLCARKVREMCQFVNYFLHFSHCY